MSGISPASHSTLSAHTTCDSSSSAPRLAATLLPKSFSFSTVLSRSACFSAVVLSVIGLVGHRSANAVLIVAKDFLSASVSDNNQVSAGDFVLIDSSKYLTLSASVRPDLMRIVRSILFMKFCRSWSSGLPMKNAVAVSVISSLSELIADGIL